MGEIKRDVLKLVEGQKYIAGSTDYVITEENTLSDIARLIVGQGWEEDLVYCINEILDA